MKFRTHTYIKAFFTLPVTEKMENSAKISKIPEIFQQMYSKYRKSQPKTRGLQRGKGVTKFASPIA